MAIGTTAAIIGSAVIGAGASALSAKSASKSASKANQTAAANNTANNQLSREFYDRNSAILEPFRLDGLRAGSTLNELLLGPRPVAASAASGGPAAGSPAISALFGNPMSSTGGDIWNDGRLSRGQTARQFVDEGWPVMMDENPIMRQQYGAAIPVASAPPAGTVNAAAPPKSAWDTFRDSTNYQFRLGEGLKAINGGYAAAGSLQSGAALKALLKYGQDYGSNELGNYMGLLANQQNMGLNAARAVAGVGGDLVSNVTANNNAATGASINAALLKGQTQAGLWGDIGGSLSRAVSALGGSSYGGNVYGSYPTGGAIGM